MASAKKIEILKISKSISKFSRFPRFSVYGRKVRVFFHLALLHHFVVLSFLSQLNTKTDLNSGECSVPAETRVTIVIIMTTWL